MLWWGGGVERAGRVTSTQPTSEFFVTPYHDEAGHVTCRMVVVVGAGVWSGDSLSHQLPQHVSTSVLTSALVPVYYSMRPILFLYAILIPLSSSFRRPVLVYDRSSGFITSGAD